MYLTGNVVVKVKYEKHAKTLIALSLISPQVRGVPTCEYDSRRKNVRKPTCKVGVCPFAKFELHCQKVSQGYTRSPAISEPH